MKKAVIIIAMVTIFISCNKTTKSSDTDSTTIESNMDNTHKDPLFACPMHPEITGKKGDHCSKCQMALTETSDASVFCCAIHKECTGKMGSKCPKCGTPLEQPLQPYSCPMHPEQKGKKGDRCLKCHMEMEQNKPGKGQG